MSLPTYRIGSVGQKIKRWWTLWGSETPNIIDFHKWTVDNRRIFILFCPKVDFWRDKRSSLSLFFDSKRGWETSSLVRKFQHKILVWTILRLIWFKWDAGSTWKANHILQDLLLVGLLLPKKRILIWKCDQGHDPQRRWYSYECGYSRWVTWCFTWDRTPTWIDEWSHNFIQAWYLRRWK